MFSMSPESIPPWVFQVLLAVPVLAGLFYYYMIAKDMTVRGGRVRILFFDLADLFMGSALAFYFGWSGVQMLLKREQAPELRPEQVRSSMEFMVAVLVVVLAFAAARRIPLGKAFHLTLDEVAEFPLRAAVALGAALPPITAAGLLWERFLPNASPQQALVSLFRNSAESGDWSAVRLVFFSALVQAPLVEEIVFRGYFYVTLKKYLGALWAALCVSALFAVVHGNLRALPSLFILSVCQIVALERFGSLLVCIGMHVCFNGLSLTLLYMESQGWLPH